MQELKDYISKNGHNFINDLSENSLQPKCRQNVDNQINNHGKQLIDICKNCDLRILNGRTKGDSLEKPTYHGPNGISVIDYIICDQNLFDKTEYFIVNPPTYLSDHSQTITWIDIGQTNDKINFDPCDIQLKKLPNQFKWDNGSKNIFRKTLKSPQIQKNINFIKKKTQNE